MTLSPTRRRVALGLRFAAVVPCLIALPVFYLAGWSLWAWGLSAALLLANIAIAFGFSNCNTGIFTKPRN